MNKNELLTERVKELGRVVAELGKLQGRMLVLLQGYGQGVMSAEGLGAAAEEELKALKRMVKESTARMSDTNQLFREKNE
jgi:phage tail tape-measure protein